MPQLVPACTRTMAVFESFARHCRQLSNSELAREIDIPETSCSDLLHTLQAGGYLTRFADSRRFYPSGKLLDVARRIASDDPVIALLERCLEQVAERTHESTSCAELEGDKVHVLLTRESPQPLRYVPAAGARLPYHTSALGKALLAALPLAERRRRLAAHSLVALTPRTQTHKAQLLAELDASAARGWAQALSEGVDGVAAFAVAGWIDGRLFAVSVSGPEGRLVAGRERCVAALREVAGALLPAAQEPA